MADEAAPAVPPPSKALRRWYALIQIVSLSTFVVLSWLAQGIERVYQHLEFKALPAPTELSITIAQGVRSAAGSVVLALTAILLVAFGLRGTFDRHLRALIKINVIGTALMIGFYVLSLYMPILRIQQALNQQ